MKEQQPLLLRPKLVVATSVDFPEASEVLVSFPDKWELIHQMRRQESLLYIAALSASQERPRPDHFYGLPAAVNLSLTSYRLYRFFKPWPMPSLIVGWNEATQTGEVLKMGDIKIQLQPLGQAQAWFGQTFAVLWECYFNETAREEGWQDCLLEIWQAVEKDIGVAKIFTQPHEPTFEEGYTEFLTRLGYQPDPGTQGWWSRMVK